MYGSYSEANRAPTAAELGCAEPDNPCLIESFLTDDPPLDQVVSKTFEFGFRGQSTPGNGQLFTWSAGLFRTLNVDDILNVASETTGRGYFLNAGDTLRQGVELAAAYQNRKYSIYGSYAFVDATFQDDLILPAPNTPNGTFNCDDGPGGPSTMMNLSASSYRTAIRCQASRVIALRPIRILAHATVEVRFRLPVRLEPVLLR